MITYRAIALYMLISCSFTQSAIPKEYDKLCEYFKKADAWGLETTIDLKHCDPACIRSKEKITQYVHELCDLIDMKRFGDTVVVHFGEDEKIAGYSMTQLIETSLISGHFANATNAVYINVFSCKLYDPNVVREFTASFFGGTLNNSKVILRK